jgi:hypothetical protein
LASFRGETREGVRNGGFPGVKTDKKATGAPFCHAWMLRTSA